MTHPVIKSSYRTQIEAAQVAKWLADLCREQCGGLWYPHTHENLGWHAVARLGDPYIATIYVKPYGDKTNDGPLFFGGFVAQSNHPGWTPGDSARGDSPFEVISASYGAIVGKASRLLQRLHGLHLHLEHMSIHNPGAVQTWEAAIQSLRLLELER